MSKEIALDLRRYTTPERLGSLIFDTASLAIEAADSELPRVNPHFFIKKGEDYVIAPGKDKRDISEMFIKDDSATNAALEIRKKLLTEDDNFSYVWISGPGPWPETRIQVGTKKITQSKKFEYLKMYDISTASLPKDKCLQLGQLLVSISPEEVDYPKDIDSLREMVIKIQIPEGQDPFAYLSKLIELPEKKIWKSILEGVADKNKAKAVRVAVNATKSVRLNPNVIYTDPIGYGAYIENRMGHEGFGMNPKRFGCGNSNNSLLATKNNFLTTTIGPNLTIGQLEFGGGDGLGPQTFSCPNCGYENRRPWGGYVYICQNERCSKPDAVVC